MTGAENLIGQAVDVVAIHRGRPETVRGATFEAVGHVGLLLAVGARKAFITWRDVLTVTTATSRPRRDAATDEPDADRLHSMWGPEGDD